MKLKRARSQTALIFRDLIIYGCTSRRNYKFDFNVRLYNLRKQGIDVKKRYKKDDKGRYMEAYLEPEYYKLALILYSIVNKEHLKIEKNIHRKNS